MSKLVSFLYKMARTANDIEKLSSGNPKKIANRVIINKQSPYIAHNEDTHNLGSLLL